MKYQVMERHGGNFNAYGLSERSQCEQVTYRMVFTGNHSGKGKSIEIVKSSGGREGGINK